MGGKAVKQPFLLSYRILVITDIDVYSSDFRHYYVCCCQVTDIMDEDNDIYKDISDSDQPDQDAFDGSSDLIDLYLKEISSISLLSAEQEL